MDKFEILKNQIENNIIDWYPFEENVDYKILKNFTKNDEGKLQEAINELNEKGRILILLDNSLSVKRICEKYNKTDLYNRKEIEDLLDKKGLKYRKFYYPLPDCYMTNVIFTDKNLPDEETINRNIMFYEKDNILKNEQNIEFKNLLKQDSNLFKIFANSFFIECSKEEFKDNEIEFVSFSNMRKEQYRIKTIIKGDIVLKSAANVNSLNHIEQIKKNIDILNDLKIDILDSYEGKNIISNYQRDKETLDKILIDYLKNGEKNKAVSIINNLFEKLKEKLQITTLKNNVFDKYKIEYTQENIYNLNFVKYGFWDMIFQNIFYIDNKYFFFDQEWIEENLPLEFIIYRAIMYNQKLQYFIKPQEIFEKFNIKEENLDIFQKLDNILQEKTRSEIGWEFHIKATKLEDIENEYNKKIEILKNEKEQMTKEYLSLLNEKDSRIKFLEENMEQTCKLVKEREETIELMQSSLSWKITKPLRKIRGKMHLKKGNEVK